MATKKKTQQVGMRTTGTIATEVRDAVVAHTIPAAAAAVVGHHIGVTVGGGGVVVSGGGGGATTATAAQVNPGCYILNDENDKEIGAMFCMPDPAKAGRNLEYYGIKALVGGAGTPDKATVFRLIWRKDFFADLPHLKSYCSSKGYNLHILATCDSGGW